MPFSRYHRTKYIVRRTVVITHVFNPVILNVIRLEPLRKTQHSRTPNSHRSNRVECSRKLRPIEVVIECGSRGEPAYYYTPSDYYGLLNELLRSNASWPLHRQSVQTLSLSGESFLWSAAVLFFSEIKGVRSRHRTVSVAFVFGIDRVWEANRCWS